MRNKDVVEGLYPDAFSASYLGAMIVDFASDRRAV